MHAVYMDPLQVPSNYIDLYIAFDRDLNPLPIHINLMQYHLTNKLCEPVICINDVYDSQRVLWSIAVETSCYERVFKAVYVYIVYGDGISIKYRPIHTSFPSTRHHCLMRGQCSVTLNKLYTTNCSLISSARSVALHA